MCASYWMPAENWWIQGLYMKQKWVQQDYPALSVHCISKVATGCASCTASIPLILLPVFSTVGVHIINICLVAAVRTEISLELGCYCVVHAVLQDQAWPYLTAGTSELYVSSVLGYILEVCWLRTKTTRVRKKKLYVATTALCKAATIK